MHVYSVQRNKEQVPQQYKESLIMPANERLHIERLEQRDNVRSRYVRVYYMAGYFQSGC